MAQDTGRILKNNLNLFNYLVLMLLYIAFLGV